MIKYFTIEDLLKHYLQKKFHILFIDVYSRMQIEQLIEKFSPTMLLVEHDMAFRDAVATKVIEI